MPTQTVRGGEGQGTSNYGIGRAGEQRSSRIPMEMQKGVVWSCLMSKLGGQIITLCGQKYVDTRSSEIYVVLSQTLIV